MANEFVTRTGLIVSGSTFLPAVTTASKGYILSFDDTTKQVYYMSTSSVTVTVPGSDTQIIYNNGGAFGAASNFVFSGSNVGIGTSSPGEKLQVVGNVYVVSGLVYGASSYSDSAVNKGMSFSGTNLLLNNSGERMRIDSSGNVGIGTSSPSQKLEVSGSGYIIKASATGSDSSYFQAVNGSYDYIAGIATSLGYGLMGMNSNHALAIMTSGSERMRITSDGNVGIGTSSPNSYAGYTALTLDHPTSGGIIDLEKAGTRIGSLNVNDGNFNIVNPIASDMLLFTTFQERLRITSTGNVGISTTSPNAKLDVNGNVIVTGSLTVSGSSTFTNIGPAVFTGSITQNASTASFGGVVGIGTTSPSQKLDVQGNIIIPQNNYLYFDNTAHYIRRGSSQVEIQGFNGINLMSSGSTRLSIAEDGHMILKSTTPGGGTQGDFYIIENGGLVIDSSEGATQRYIEFTTGGTQKMLITAAGNVGIGVSPSYKLDVNGQSRIAGQLILSGVGTSEVYTADASGLYLTAGTAAGMYLQSDGTFYFRKASNPYTEYMRIAGTGDVQIGTTAYAGIGGSGYLMVKNVIGLVPDNTASTNNRNWAIQANGQFSGSLDFVTSAASASFPNDAYRVSFTRTGGVVASSFTGSFSGSVSAPGSTTQIVYNSGGALAADSGLVYSGSNVGIGTTNPNARLTVVANDSSDPNVALRLSSTGYSGVTYPNTSIRFGSAYSSYPSWNLASIDAGYTGASWGGSLLFYTNNDSGETNLTERMRITSAGNVGIGTTSPSAQLHIKSTSEATLTLDSAASNASTIYFKENGTSIHYISADGSIANNPLNFYDYALGGVAMTINAGNVGIGTTSPTAKLDVRTDTGILIKGATSDTDGRVSIIPASGGRQYDLRNYGSSFGIKDASADVVRMFFHNNGNTGIANGTTTPTDTLQVEGGRISVTSGSTFGLSIEASGSGGRGGIISTKAGSDWNPVMYFTSQSRVGIGTGAPAYLLDVAGTGKFSGNINLGSSGEHYLQNDASTTFIGLNFDSPYIRFAVNNTERMRITSAGDVGIGTGSPSTLLDVRGEVSVAYSATYGLRFYNDARNNWSFIGNSVSGSSSANLRFGDATGEVMRITGGNVGIGITNPAATLDVNGGSIIRGNLTLAGGSRYITGDGGDLFIDTENVSGRDILLQTVSGQKVGIGTTAPGAKLDIVSTGAGSEGLRVDGSGGGFAFVVKAGSDYTSHIRAGATVGVNYFTTPPSNGLIVEGNVGIGTSSPTSQFHIYNNNTYSAANINETTSSLMAFKIRTRAGVGTNIVMGAFDSTQAGLQVVDINASAETQGFLINPYGGNVGIGVTNPTYNLHVSSSGYYGGNLTVEGTITAQKLNVQQITSSVVYSSGSNIFGNDISNTQTFTGSVLITGSEILNGKLYLGTTSPSTANSLQLSYNTTSGDGVVSSYSSGGSTTLALQTSDAGSPATRLYINSSGNVGIGTSTPGYLLDVKGTGRFDGNVQLYAGSAGNSPRLIFGGETSSTDKSIFLESYYMVFQGHDNEGFKFNTTTSGGSITNRMVILGSGNVGIGTTSPNNILHLYTNYAGSSNSGSAITITSDGSGGDNGWIGVNKGTGNGLTLGVENRDIIFQTDNTTAFNGTERMRITTDGNVGIGTNSPGAKLEVKPSGDGDIFIGRYSGGSAKLIYAYQSSADGFLEIRTGNDGTVTKLSGYGGTPSYFLSNVGIGTSSPISGQGTPLTLASSTGYVGLTLSGSGAYSHLWQLYASGDGGSNKFFGIYDSTNATYRLVTTSGGNVGIGTTGPAYKLSINGSAGIEANEEYFYFHSNYSVGSNARAKIRAVGAGGGSGYGGDFRISTRATNNTWNEDAVTVDYAGNVGIGTTSPGERLQVQTSIRVEGSTPAYNLYESTTHRGNLQWQTTSNYVGVRLFNIDNSNLMFGTNNTERMRIDTNGNVGIGTTTPVLPLQVSGRAQFGDTTSMASFTNAPVGIRTTSTESITLTHTAVQSWSMGVTSAGTFALRDIDTPADRLVVTQAGNVGIGTTSPSTKLFVSGSHVSGQGMSTFKGSDYAIVNLVAPAAGDGSNGYWGFRAQDSNFNDLMWFGHVTSSTQSGFIVAPNFNTANSASFYVARSNGNVGIGTTSPSATLQVNGTTKLGGGTLQISTDQNFSTNYSYTFRDAVGINNPNSLSAASATTVMSIGSMTNGVSLITTGNVGIGTTNPTYQLDVSGTGRFTSYIAAASGIFSQGYGETLQVYQTNATNNTTAIIRQTTAGGNGNQDIGLLVDIQGAADTDRIANFRYYDGSTYTSRMAIMRGGNVGIGTTSPSAKLEISGFSTGAGLKLNYGNSSGTIEAINFIANGGANGVIGMQMVSAGVGDLWLGGSGGRSLTLYRDGNVGIGTTAPDTKLHIVNDSATTNAGVKVLTLTQSTSGTPASGLGPGITFVSERPSGNVLLERAAIYGIAGADANDDGDLAFYTRTDTGAIGVSEKMRITSDGNVGIGTTNPAADGLTIRREGSDKRTLLQLDRPNTPGLQTNIRFTVSDIMVGQIQHEYVAANYNHMSFTLRSPGGGDIIPLWLENSGNVGIGTTSPNFKLQVDHGTGAQYAASFRNTNDNLQIKIGTTTGSLLNIQGATISTNAAYNIALQAEGGNVGIGTTSPSQKLQVSGSIYIAKENSGVTVDYAPGVARQGFMKYENYSSGLVGLTTTVDNNVSIWIGRVTGNIYSPTTIYQDLVVSTAGNIGIGTISPSYKLQVSGSIAIENQGTTTIESTTFSGSLTGNTNIAFVPTASFKAAFFDYYVASGSVNMRAGTVMAVHNNSTSRYTDTSTADIGTTAPVDFSTSIVAGSLVLTANIASGTWEIKTAYRAL